MGIKKTSLQICAGFLMCFIAIACAQQKKYISYTVKNGDTLQSIASRLNITTEDLLRLNPNIDDDVSANTIIIIPNKSLKQLDKDKVTTKENDTVIENDSLNVDELKKTFVIHQVKKGDTFYSLTRFYNVSENELMELNPELVEGLQLDMILKIKPITNQDEAMMYVDTIQKSEISLAMLLPFRALEYDSIQPKEIFTSSTLANITTDLYLGAEIAVDSLQKQGLTINLQWFDTGKKNQKIDAILNTNEFRFFDAIIGPLYSEELPKVANRTLIPVVFPVYSKNQSNFNFSRIVKTQPDKTAHEKQLLNHIVTNYSNENIVIVSDSTSASIKKAKGIRSILQEQDTLFIDSKIIYASNGYIPKHIIVNALTGELANWVILATDKSIVASDVVNSLISLPHPDEEEEEEGEEKKKTNESEMQILPEDTVVKLFAFDKGSKFDKVDNSKLAKLSFTFTSDVFVDENSLDVKQFNKQYQQKNNTYPSYYATKGFDIVYDTAIRLASGKSLKQTFREGSSFRLETKFDYSRKLFETTSNNGLFIIQYQPNLTLKRLK